MSTNSSQLRDRIRQSFPDTSDLSAIIEDEIQKTGRRARKDRINEINTVILESALEFNSPDLIPLLQDIPHENQRALFSTLLSQYIKTRNDAWFDMVIALIEEVGKKGDQSEVLAQLCRKLIESGSAQSDQLLITKGLTLFSRITFRKYRSEILIQISPFLIEWAVSKGDVLFLRTLRTMTEEIADISKQSVIHARLATGIAAIGIQGNDLAIWSESIQNAADIRQKMRRKACFATIVQAAVSSPVFEKIRDIPATVTLLSDLEPIVLHEVIASILQQVLVYENNRTVVADTLHNLAARLPSEKPVIVTSLLKQAEASGDPWFFMQAINLQECIDPEVQYPVREFIKAALAVVRTTGSSDALRLVVPAVVSSCSPAEASRILLQIVQVLLSQGELSEALTIFVSVENDGQKSALYDECITAIWKHAIVADRITEVNDEFIKQIDRRQWSEAIYHAVDDICKQHAFSEITDHADSLAGVMALHSQQDQLVLDSINLLIHRGFLETSDPDVLIRLTHSIKNPVIRERALSTIVIRVAKQGVDKRSRDFLQRAVGLSCFIEDEKTRSSTLTAVIDEATMLAVIDGDLDLLRRMREWSVSLLSHDGGTAAISKIIEGMITYAADGRHPAALDEAFLISAEIADPALKKDVTERISESYVRIGCQLLQDLDDEPPLDEFLVIFRLFERGLSILTSSDRQEDHSLKIARIIDIILDSSKERFRIDTIIPLTLYALEIRQAYERDAMVARIAPMIRMHTDQTDSTDPYNGIVEVLLHIPYVLQDPVLLDLVLHSAEQIKDPFTRLYRLSTLAGLYIRTGRKDQAQRLLDGICGSLDKVSGKHRQVILLGDCAIHYSYIAEEPAHRAVDKAIGILQVTDYDPDGAARMRVVSALSRLNEIRPDPDLIEAARNISIQISEPVDFITAMFLVYKMAAGMPEYRYQIAKQIRQASDAITVAAVRASLLLDLTDLLIQDRDYAAAAGLLIQISDTTDSIKIPFLADTIRSRIAEAYVRIGKWQDDKTCFSHASDIINTIEHEDIRMFASGLHEKVRADVSSLYHDIVELAGHIIMERYSPAQLNGLETMILSVQDRGLIVRYFCRIAIQFNNAGKTRLARRFFENALDEAVVIRPLSRRAYVLCDCAIMLDKAGCQERAQEVMGRAIDAATGIRRFADRDEVFDNLAAAVRWMQEEQPA